MHISTDFPGGNIVVEKFDGDTVHLRPDLRDTEGEWFYWYFEVSSAQGRTVRFQFSGGCAFAARGPLAKSGDGLWGWLGAEAVKDNGFTYAFGPEETTVRFSMTLPYTQRNWDTFLARQREEGHDLVSEMLCTSRAGRSVEMLRLGNTQTPQHRIVITARHHACETMASYALEGILHHLLEPGGRWLRENAEFLFVPFADKDGAEAGDQGKNRRPRDHNRDYEGAILYPEITALRDLLPKWSRGKLRAALDLHCPWIAGGLNEKLYLVGSRHERIWREQVRFAEILEQKPRAGFLPFRAADSLPFGQDWNTATNFATGRSFADWVTDLPEVVFSASVEIPYAVASGHDVQWASARMFGMNLAEALATYLQGKQEPAPRSP